jgi:hypothetical protein
MYSIEALSQVKEIIILSKLLQLNMTQLFNMI